MLSQRSVYVERRTMRGNTHTYASVIWGMSGAMLRNFARCAPSLTHSRCSTDQRGQDPGLHLIVTDRLRHFISPLPSPGPHGRSDSFANEHQPRFPDPTPDLPR